MIRAQACFSGKAPDDRHCRIVRVDTMTPISCMSACWSVADGHVSCWYCFQRRHNSETEVNFRFSAIWFLFITNSMCLTLHMDDKLRFRTALARQSKPKVHIKRGLMGHSATLRGLACLMGGQQLLRSDTQRIERRPARHGN